MTIPTIGGVATKGEAFTKLLYHLDEARDMAAVISHLHNTEDSEMDKLLARGWIGIAELLKMQREHIVKMAQRKLN